MADGVIVCDSQGVIQHSNAAAARMVELGRSLPEALPALPFDLMVGQLDSEGSFERTFNLPRGQVVRLLATPLGRGELEGVVCVLQDETERERVERMKSEFLSMVSHELKTPITTIQAFQELLLFREFPPERQKRFHQICYDESVRLQKLIEAILDLSRLEAGTFAFQRVPCRLDDVLSSVLPGFLEQPEHRFEVHVDPDVPELSLDPTLMAQAVQNLVSNAVKYTPPDRGIRVTLRREPGRLVFGVEDEGIGIPKDKIPLVFEKFFRADNGLTRAQGGTGLGLANARYIVEGHGGSIWVESEEGRGSHFQFSLPV
jgi:signal transduction histidine kinase